jgi:uncharacterized iron-regulated membrane protein
MYQAILLRLHRWLTLIFALPLLVVIGTGFVLSFEPIAQTVALRPGSLTAATLTGILDRHDPDGKASGIAYRPYENIMAISGVGEAPIEIDVATGQKIDGNSPSWAKVFGTSRRWHEHMIFDLRWLVTASTIALLVLAALGVLMGWPRLRMSVAGWHKGIAWFTLPLVVLSALTGLAIAFGITFAPGFGGARPAPLPLKQAIAMAGQSRDLSGLIWLRARGGRQLARLNEGGELRVYVVTAEGLTPMARNWPRLIHEGNWAGVWSALINVATSVALIGLLGTGLYLWLSRKLRRRDPRPRATSTMTSARAI